MAGVEVGVFRGRFAGSDWGGYGSAAWEIGIARCKVVATMNRGDWLLLIPGDDFEAAQEGDVPVVRVSWRSRKWLMRPASLNAQLKQGSWQRVELPEAELQALLGDLERVDGPGVNEPWEITPWQPPQEEAPRRIVRHHRGQGSGANSS